MVTLQDVEAARETIRPHIYQSPCAYSATLSEKAGAKIFLKLENLQMTGSFKERGALNRLNALSPKERARGVIAASAGNHAQGVSFHAKRLSIDATIVMPRYTPLVKVTSTRRYGARVVLHGDNYDAAFDHAQALAATEGRILIHAFNDPWVIAGQGTIGLELLEQNPYLDAVIVPIGGGGLISGIAVALKEINPRIKVYGVEAELMPSMLRSIEAGHIVDVPAHQTLADGIAVKTPGTLTFDLVRRYVDDIVTVTDEEIASAVLTLLEVEKTVAEGSAATTLAAALSGKLPIQGKKVALLICGGNIDVTVLSRIIRRGLVNDGRMAQLSVRIDDGPGALSQLAGIIGATGGNIVDIRHERAFARGSLRDTEVTLTLEARGSDHIKEIVTSLEAAGIYIASQ
jgi:threonine dehydratase